MDQVGSRDHHPKQATDVLLHGHAFAPRGRRVSAVDVELRVGEIAKRLRVSGRRVWQRGMRGPRLPAPEPFDRLPLTYELAYGGMDPRAKSQSKPCGDPRNPVGTGFAADPRDLTGVSACSVEYPAAMITSPADRPSPASFGPIARHWSPRLEWAGTYDESWETQRRPLPPRDFQAHYHQCAPEDQQARPFLRGGEPVCLVNLTPSGELRFSLPRVVLGFETRIRGGWAQHRQSLQTVIIEPDEARLIMVWQSTLPCHDALYSLQSTRIIEKERLGRS